MNDLHTLDRILLFVGEKAEPPNYMLKARGGRKRGKDLNY